MEPSDYYPDAYYREPPDDPRSQEMPGRTANSAAPPNKREPVRHRGRAEHLHLQRSRFSDTPDRSDWET